MPYIKPAIRQEFLAEADILGERIQDVGELNYVLTTIVMSYLNKDVKNYARLNGILGVFEGAKQEFYRRVVAPYEDEKIKQNGDVY